MKSLIILIMIILFSFSINSAEPSSIKLNKMGYEKYKNSDYEGALILFEDSIKSDPDYALPYYNAACTIGLILKYLSVGYPEEIEVKEKGLGYLSKAIKLNPEFVENAKKDNDFEKYRNEIEYYYVLGYNSNNIDELKEVLLNIWQWEVSKDNDQSYDKNYTAVRFRKNDNVIIPNYFFETKYDIVAETKGKYVLIKEKDCITVKITMEKEKNGSKILHGKFNEKFHLIINNFSTKEPQTVFYPRSIYMRFQI